MPMRVDFSSCACAAKFRWQRYARAVSVCCLLFLMAISGGLPHQTAPISPAAPPAAASSDDVIVADVATGSGMEKAGLRADDVLLSYNARPLATPFSLLSAVANCPGAAKVKVRRGSQIVEIALPEGMPISQGRVMVRPALSAEVLPLYQAGLAEYVAKDWEAAGAKWRDAFKVSEAAKDGKIAAWLCGQIATCYQEMAGGTVLADDPLEAQVKIKHVMEAQAWLTRAWEHAKGGQDKAAQAILLKMLGMGLLNLGSIDEAFSWFEQSYAICSEDGDEVWAAEARILQGLIVLSRHVTGMSNFRDAVTPKDRAAKAKDLALAQRCCEEALEIRKQLLPASAPLAESYMFVGEALMAQEKFAEAQARYALAIATYQQLALSALTTAQTRAMLQAFAEAGNLAGLRGDAMNAQRWSGKALALDKENNYLSQEMRCGIFNNLATMCASLGDMEQANQHCRQALNACPKFGQGWREQQADCLLTQAILAAAQRDFATARRACEQALAVWRKGASDYQEGRATLLNILGILDVSENHIERAKQRYTEALNIWQAAQSRGVGMAVSLNGLGLIAAAKNDLAGAQAKFQRARDILRGYAVQTSPEPTIAANLGRVYLRWHQYDKALPLLEEAAAVLETRRQRIPDLDNRALFMQRFAAPFSDLIQACITLHQNDKAFAALERLHARAFADNLAEEGFHLDQNLPLALKARQQELDNARCIGEKDLQRAERRKDRRAAGAAQQAIANCAARQRQLDADIRQNYAQRIGHDIAYPHPIDRKAAQECLPDGVLALAYAVDDDSGCVFALTRTSFHVYPLSLSRNLLKQRVMRARELLTDIHSPPAKVERVLQDLYRDLLKPAQADISRARSLLICPDAAMHLLPLAALMPGKGRFLIQDKPVTMTASLTVYRSLRSQARPRMSSLLALGDPAYDAPPPPRRNARAGAPTAEAAWERLPETGAVAQEISAEYAPQSPPLLQEQATVSNFMARCGEASIVHVGCHAVADDRNPFGSWLALAPASKEDDGRLAAWQILRLRLQARLVVLWGCGTGLGAENRYEGILALPRAFQTAGAENVLTTLWEVHPAETSDILLDFYHACKAGKDAPNWAAALRQAQVKAIQSKTNSQPYFWAAFALDGVGE